MGLGPREYGRILESTEMHVNIKIGKQRGLNLLRLIREQLLGNREIHADSPHV
jgi:hypothetical protein